MESENMFMKRKGISAFFSCALFGISVLLFGGTALAASMPVVATLENKYDMKGLTKPGGIAIDQTRERIYVTDTIDQVIHVFNFKGRKVNSFRTVKVPNSIAVGSDGIIYVVGYSNGAYTIFSVNGETGVNNGPLNISAGLQMPRDPAVDSLGNVYVVDTTNKKIMVFDKTGVLKNPFGPYIFERVSETLKDSVSNTTSTYARTRHSMLAPTGVAINESQGELYVQFRELVERGDSYAISSCSSVQEGSTWWTPVGDYYKVVAIGLQDGVLNQQKTMLLRDFTTDSGSCSSTTSSGAVISPRGLTVDAMGRLYAADGYWGLRVFDVSDGKSLDQFKSGRVTINSYNSEVIINGNKYRSAVVSLPAAMTDTNYTVSFVSPTRAGDGFEGDPSQIIVTNKSSNSFTVNIPSKWLISLNDNATLLGTVIPWRASYFPSAAPAHGLAFDSKNKRLLSTVIGGNSVDIYGIDGGSNPGNNAPEAPQPISPADKAVISTASPALGIRASYDADGDPLAYSYEITSPAGTVTGTSSGTTYTPAPLTENTEYSWRARSNDGEGDSSWSVSYLFCVNAKNDPPPIPEVSSPKDLAAVSAFSTPFSWNPSTDKDCGQDSVTYTIEVSADPGFASVLVYGEKVSGSPITLSSLGRFDTLKNKNTYYWRVKAVDSHDAASDYDAGSFTYKTTVVNFTSDQPGTKVYIDGNYGYFGRLLGTAPVEVQNLTPGRHFVTFVKPGYEPYHYVTDPLVEDVAVTVSAIMNKASKIRPSSPGSDLLMLDGGFASPFVVDYNNDGLKDIIVGSGDGRLYLYLAEVQDGVSKLAAKGAMQAEGVDINVTSRAVPFVVDYNNDSLQDLMVGSGDGLIHLYLNTGDGAVPAFRYSGPLKDIKVSGNSAPAVVDYNNNGKKDLIVGSSEGTLRLYLNSGTDASPAFSAPGEAIKVDGIELSVVNASPKAFFTDWNSDGKKDMVVGGNTVNLFLNVGTDEAPDFRSISDLQQWIKEKKRERGNREFIPYLGYTQDLGDLAGGRGDASPFVVDWDGSTGRDIVVGNGGGVGTYITGE